jgi:hypothetical protein
VNYLTSKVFRFRISLEDIEPEIWREIDVPENYNFWELHVAIQDAMGWLDYHLHEFVPNKNGPTKGKRIGVQGFDDDDDNIIAGWDLPIKKYFSVVGNSIEYDYDFGDSWRHQVTLIGIFLEPMNAKYPVCYAGERACPPEDCGGISGYQHLLEVLNDPENDEYEDMIEWLKGHAKNYWPYKPDTFSAKRVKFSDPYKRWCLAFDQPYDESR